MIDLVYPLSTKKSDSFFIRNSVKLVIKNVKNFGRIFTIGRDPHIQGVTNYPMGDPNILNVEANIIRKTVYACQIKEISDPFVWMNDDFFILKPLDINDVGLNYKYDLFDEKDNTLYGRRCLNTARVLKSLGLPTLNYEAHRPTLIHKKEYIMAMSKVDWDNEGVGILCTSIYGNVLKTGKRMEDAKTIVHKAESVMITHLEDADIISPGRRPGNRIKEFIISKT